MPQRQLLDLTVPGATTQYDAQLHVVTDYRFGDAASGPVDLLPTGLNAGTETAAATTAAAGEIGKEVAPPAQGAFKVSFPNPIALIIVAAVIILAVALVFNHRYRRLYSGVAWTLTVLFLAAPIVRAQGADLAQHPAGRKRSPQPG